MELDPLRKVVPIFQLATAYGLWVRKGIVVGMDSRVPRAIFYGATPLRIRSGIHRCRLPCGREQLSIRDFYHWRRLRPGSLLGPLRFGKAPDRKPFFHRESVPMPAIRFFGIPFLPHLALD